jgi:hypothetical protein
MGLSTLFEFVDLLIDIFSALAALAGGVKKKPDCQRFLFFGSPAVIVRQDSLLSAHPVPGEGEASAFL